MPVQRLHRLAALTLASLALTGCATWSPDGGFGQVDQLTRARLGQAPSWQRSAADTETARQHVAELLNRPLDAEGAVQIALLNQPELQAAYAQLGVAEADRVRAGRLANPTLRFGRLSSGPGRTEIDRGLMFDLLGLLTLPVAQQIEQQRFERAQLQAALDTVTVATEARKAFFEAVAARQLLDYSGQVHEAAAAAGELARRMAAAGNFSALAQMREQAFQADAALQLARARHQALASREQLLRALGLGEAPANLRLPDRLPDLPAAPVEPRDAEQTAMQQRLDVLMARRDTEATARALGLTQATRVINVLHAGVQNKSASGEPTARGVEIELELPLFDFGSTRLARAEAVYMQSVHTTAAVANRARSEVRESYSAYRTAYELARHYRDEVVPLRKRISEENLLRYNGMLTSVFDLLVDAREQVNSVVGAVSALRAHWIAETDLQLALTSRSPTGSRAGDLGPAASGGSTAGAAGGH
jgi:outer membrane protein TolC